MPAPTYYGPKTIEECKETIALYERRMAKRPSSADRYQGHIDEAKKNLELLQAGAKFDIATQSFK